MTDRIYFPRFLNVCQHIAYPLLVSLRMLIASVILSKAISYGSSFIDNYAVILKGLSK